MNSFNGMSGYLANFFSLSTKNKIATLPKTIRQMTVGLFHGKASPPKSRPSRSIRVTPRIDKLPSQSIARMPSRKVVFGL